MKNIVCLLVIIVLVLVFSSCEKGDFNTFFCDKNNKLADTRMEELFDAIKHKNGDVIKKMFSEKAVNEAGELDVEIEDLLSFVQGKVASWSRDESPIVFDSNEEGGKKKQLVTWYTLNTDEQSYLVFLVDYPMDTIDPKNNGLYSIRILKAEDEGNLLGTWEEWVIPGVYVMNN